MVDCDCCVWLSLQDKATAWVFDSSLLCENGGYNIHKNIYLKPMVWDKASWTSFRNIFESVSRDQAHGSHAHSWFHESPESMLHPLAGCPCHTRQWCWQGYIGDPQGLLEHGPASAQHLASPFRERTDAEKEFQSLCARISVRLHRPVPIQFSRSSSL